MKRIATIMLICTALAAHAQVRISELPQATNTAGAQFVIIQGGATKRIAEGVVRTIPATNVTGLGPFAISTNLAISNVGGLQIALESKLGTNGTLPVANITGLGIFATRTNLVGSDISDFSNAVVAVSPPTTNASLLTTGTLDDARISTNIARASQLVASNITGLGIFATRTNLVGSDIADLASAVVAVAPPTTNASLLTTGTLPDARLSTNVRSHIGLGWSALTNSNAATSLLGTTAGGDLVFTGTNALNFTNDVKFTTPTTTVLRFQSPYKSVDFLATDEGLAAGYDAPRWSFGSDDGGFRVKYGTSDVEWGAVLYLDNNNDGGIARTNLGLGPYATATNLTTANISDFGDEVISVLSQPALAWKLAAYDGDPTIATNEYGMGWDELGRFTLQTPVGAFQLYGTGNPSVPTLYFPGKIVSQSFEAISVNAPIKATMVYGGSSGGTLSQEILNESMPKPLYEWLGVRAISSGIPATEITNETSSANYFDLIPGAYFPVAVVTNVEDAANEIYGAYQTPAQVRSNLALGPFATATNLQITNVSGLQSALDGKLATNGTLAISNVSGLQGALDAKLATNGTLPATNITGLGPYAVATNLSSVDISDFSNAVVSFAPPTTNAASLTTGTLADARLSTNVAFLTNLGPFATATNLQISNVSGLQGALDGKLATNGMLPATNITGLGPYAIATNLSSSDISNFSNSVVSFAPATTNASLLTSGTLADARLSTNVILQTNLGALAYLSNVATTNISSGAAARNAVLLADGSGGAAFTTNYGAIYANNGTITNSQPVLDIGQTWNSTNVVTALRINASNTSSAAESLLLDLQVSGASKFSVNKTGNVTLSVIRGDSTGNGTITYIDSNTWRYSANGVLCAFGRDYGRSASFFNADEFIVGYVANASVSQQDQVVIARDAANVMALRNITNSQQFRVYGWYTNSSNYARVSLGMSNNGTAYLRPERAGTNTNVPTNVYLHISGLPTNDVGTGILWNSNGTVMVGQ